MDQLKVIKIKSGWMALNGLWAVSASSKEDVIQKYHEREAFYNELKKHPFWFENPDNPKNNTMESL